MRIKLLANHIGCEPNMITQSQDKANLFQYGKSDYLVLTHEEANTEARQQINDALWSLDASLIKKYLKTDISLEVIERVQAEMCPNCTLLLLSLMVDPDLFYTGIINKFGRGYFIAFHDCREHIAIEPDKCKHYYIYRLS